MATLQQEQSGERTVWRIQWRDGSKRRKRIRLGEQPEKTARFLFNRIDQLIARRIAGQPIDSDTAKWLSNLGDDLHEKLSNADLCEARQSATLAELIDNYIASREDAEGNTVRNWRNSREKLTNYFGEDIDFRSITSANSHDWQQSLVNAIRDDGRRKYSSSTISKATKHAKQFAKVAIRNGLADANPFDELVAGGEENAERKQFVSRETIAKAIDAAPDAEWRAIIALVRFGGLRCPSEVFALKWTDIDWADNRFTVRSRKTKRHGKARRTVPLFPELRHWLGEALDAAPDGSEFVVSRHRNRSCNLRTGFERILARASIEPWERLFHNLRASRQTELQSDFPTHCVCDWMGNSEAIAHKHYLTTTESHFEQAAGWGPGWGQTGGVGPQVGPKPAESDGNEKHATTDGPTTCEKTSGFVQPAKYPVGESNPCRRTENPES